MDFKYNNELTQTFMSSNQIGGFFNRLEASRKYLFGSMGVLGQTNDSVISGALIARGQDIKPVVDVAPDWESYEYKRLDLSKPEDKAFFEAALAWDLEIDGKKWVDGKNVRLPCCRHRLSALTGVGCAVQVNVSPSCMLCVRFTRLCIFCYCCLVTSHRPGDVLCCCSILEMKNNVKVCQTTISLCGRVVCDRSCDGVAVRYVLPSASHFPHSPREHRGVVP